MATKQGQFLIHGGLADSLVVDNEDYKVRVKKSFEPITKVWHIKFESQSVYDYKFELFLSDEELSHLKRIL